MRPMTERDAKQWRAIALSGAAACGLLAYRLLTGSRPVAADAWDAVSDHLPGFIRDDLGETRGQEIERRLGACEAHLTDLEERFTPIDQYLGVAARHAMGHRDA